LMSCGVTNALPERKACALAANFSAMLALGEAPYRSRPSILTLKAAGLRVAKMILSI